MGEIRCAAIRRGQLQPSIPGFSRVNVSSMSTTKNIYRNLSPMLMGPLYIEEPIQPNQYYPNGIHPGYAPIVEEVPDHPFTDQLLPNKLYSHKHDNVLYMYFTNNDRIYRYSRMKAVCQTFERYWQGGKVYQKEIKDGILQKSFFEERAKMYRRPAADKQQRRRKYPRSEGIPISSYYQGHTLDYVPSRKAVYIPTYLALLAASDAYKKLKERHLSGEKLLIVGPDGRDISIEHESLSQAVNDPRYIFGHELVLCAQMKDIKLL